MPLTIFPASFPVSETPVKYIHLGDGLFVTVSDLFRDPFVYFYQYILRNNMYECPTASFHIDPIRWTSLFQNMEINYCMVVPEKLFIYKKKHIYYIQLLDTRDDNFHFFRKHRFFMNESQWHELKEHRILICEHLTTLMFGNLLSLKLQQLSPKSEIQNDNSSLEYLCDMILKCIIPHMASLNGSKEDIWRQGFFPAVFKLDLDKLTRQFWKDRQTIVATQELVKPIFDTVFNMYMSSTV